MKIEDIYQYFKNPQFTYLNQELAVCYILFVLLKADSYGTELILLLERDYSVYRLSDTVLYGALKFLEEEKVISGYWKKVGGRGRPRRMYQIIPSAYPQAESLAYLWQSYLTNSNHLIRTD